MDAPYYTAIAGILAYPHTLFTPAALRKSKVWAKVKQNPNPAQAPHPALVPVPTPAQVSVLIISPISIQLSTQPQSLPQHPVQFQLQI